MNIYNKICECCTIDDYNITNEINEHQRPPIEYIKLQEESTTAILSKDLENKWSALMTHLSQQLQPLPVNKKIKLINPKKDIDKLMKDNIMLKLQQQPNLTIHSITFKNNQIKLEINRHSNNRFGKFINLFRQNKVVTINQNTPLKLSRLQNPLPLYNEISSSYNSYTLAQNETAKKLFTEIKNKFNSVCHNTENKKEIEKKLNEFLTNRPIPNN